MGECISEYCQGGRIFLWPDKIWVRCPYCGSDKTEGDDEERVAESVLLPTCPT